MKEKTQRNGPNGEIPVIEKRLSLHEKEIPILLKLE
jgi:hypothetical protein